MRIEGKSLKERIIGALVVFAVFVLFNYFQTSYSWTIILVTPVVFFVIMVVIDATRNRIIQ